ncbi:MAG: hypothetical protein HKM07_03835 [Chlamydiae bacterium]|nr:hypothetical protein [Chlamydiota bacterium]
MSGIEEMKKRTKLSMEEMYDNPIAEKVEIQKNVSQERQKPIKTLNQESVKETIQKLAHPEIQQPKQTDVFPVKQVQPQKAPTYKMTFMLTEDIYKAFNDLYAKRMLQGRKTEKSDLICEAIEWLIKMEGEK